MPIIKSTLVNVDQYGSNNDSGVLPHLRISSAFENITLNLPESKVLSVTNLHSYFLVGDTTLTSASASRKASRTTRNELKLPSFKSQKGH